MNSLNKTQVEFSHAVERCASDLLRLVPPHSIEAEQAVLGGIFNCSSALHNIAASLSPDDFYVPTHKALYAACLALHYTSAPIDLVTLTEYLRKSEQLEYIGGAKYLASLVQGATSTANIEFHAAIVREKTTLRELITTGVNIISDCAVADAEAPTVLDKAEQRLFGVSRRWVNQKNQKSGDLFESVIQNLIDGMEKGDRLTGISTGFARLDELTAGLHPSDLIIIGGRPAMGKTALALSMYLRGALQYGTPVAIFSLGMSSRLLGERMLSMLGLVDYLNLRRGMFSDAEWQRLVQAKEILTAAPLYINDTDGLSTLELRARARRLKAEKNIGLLVVDDLHRLRSSRSFDSREQEISNISRSLKELAIELDIPVVALAQLNRNVEKRLCKRPILTDLRESGAIEYDADVVMFIHREEVYDRTVLNEDKAEIIIAKQHNGPTVVIEISFIPQYALFAETMGESSQCRGKMDDSSF